MNLKDFHIGISPLGKQIHLGKVNKEGSLWLDKKEITEEFERCAFDYFQGKIQTTAFEKSDGTVDVFEIQCKLTNMSKEEWEKKNEQ